MKLLAALLVCCSLLAAQQKELTILHWNDFHAQNLPYQVKTKNRVTNTDTSFFVGGSATLAAYIKQQRAASRNVLLLNAGDDFQGSPISAITQGRSQIELMNLHNPDAMALGNHDFDYGRTVMSGYMRTITFPMLGANIIDDRTNKPYAAPYVIKTIDGISVGIIGLMTEELPTLSLPDNVKELTVKSLSATVNGLIPELKKQKVDLIIAVTHNGVREDSILAVNSPDLDIIVGGHSHTPLFRPKIVNGIVIVQAGSRGRWLGKVTAIVDTEKDTVIRSSAELIECRTADITPDSVVHAKVMELESLASKELNEQIGVLKSDWKRDGDAESAIGNWISDAMRSYAGTDIAVQNSGGIRKDMLAGPVVVRDFWEVSPFGNTLVTFTVDGATLRTMVQHQLSIQGDFCQVSGMTITYRIVSGEKLLHNLKVNGVLVNDAGKYSVVTNNYVAAQSKKYFGIELAPDRLTQLNTTDRDVLIAAARKQQSLDARVEGRIKETAE